MMSDLHMSPSRAASTTAIDRQTQSASRRGPFASAACVITTASVVVRARSNLHTTAAPVATLAFVESIDQSTDIASK